MPAAGAAEGGQWQAETGDWNNPAATNNDW